MKVLANQKGQMLGMEDQEGFWQDENLNRLKRLNAR